MNRLRYAFVAATIVAGITLACSSEPAAPAAPTNTSTAAADGSTLKATAPVPVSPVNDASVPDTPTLTANGSTTSYVSGVLPLQYRFEVFNDAGTKIQDSGLMPSPSFKITATLDFNKRYTWHARAEYQSGVGPWSTTASFISPQGGYLRANEA